MSKINCGIDIGASGAYSVFVDGVLAGYGAIPGEEELHMGDLLECINNLTPRCGPDECHYYHFAFEDLHSVYGSSASSNFQFGINNGLVIGMLQTIGVPFTKVQAKKWQKEMWEGIRPVEKPVKGKFNKDGSQKYKIDTKATSILAGQRLFPKEKFTATDRAKVPNHNIVDAVLIGLYCVRHF